MPTYAGWFVETETTEVGDSTCISNVVLYRNTECSKKYFDLMVVFYRQINVRFD